MSKFSSSNDPIEAVRAFNRLYTRQIGLLDEHLLESEFSLTEARVLYELAQSDGLTATQLRRDLGLDAGYLSRILKRLERRELVIRTPCPEDGRQARLVLSPTGRAVFQTLDQASREQIAAMLGRLTAGGRKKLVAAMGTIRSLLEGKPQPRVPYLLRSLQIGDIGWIIRRHGMLYAEEYGWDETFEAFVAEIAAAFVKNFDPRRECCWIAEREGEIVGSVFVEHSAGVAKLRMLYVEPAARGLGIGSRLVDECVRFARARGYKALTLWTNDVLVSARRIYEAAGFRLVAEERHHSFGKELVGQNWILDL